MPRQSPIKKTRDLERTRKAILDNAAKLFAAKGFAGTSVAQIAKAAKVHKRMLHYCYGSKSGLYKEVVEHTAAHYSETISGMPEDFSSLLIYFDEMFRSHRMIMRFLAWEGLEAGPHKLAGYSGRRRYYNAVQAKIRESQDKGRLPRGMKPYQIHMIMVALATFPYAFPTVYRLITGTSPSDKNFNQEQREFLRLFGGYFFDNETNTGNGGGDSNRLDADAR